MNKTLTLIDTPGIAHFDNFIFSITDSDAVLLVVDAKKGVFEDSIRSGMSKVGPLACYATGVEQMVVAVNNLDDTSVNGNRDRFEYIKAELEPHLKKTGYNTRNVEFVPSVSSVYGDFSSSGFPNMAWYKGLTLIEALDKLKS